MGRRWTLTSRTRMTHHTHARIHRYYETDGYLESSPACRRAVREAVDALKAAGHTLVPFTPPDVDEAMGIFFALLSCGAEHIADELEGETVADALTKLMLQVVAFLPCYFSLTCSLVHFCQFRVVVGGGATCLLNRHRGANGRRFGWLRD